MPEICWVRVTGQHRLGAAPDGWQVATLVPIPALTVYEGRLLNQPNELVSVMAGDTVRFVAPREDELPLMVSDEYVAERPFWSITPCRRCGLGELLDPPSAAVQASGVLGGLRVVGCPRCGGSIGLREIGVAITATGRAN